MGVYAVFWLKIRSRSNQQEFDQRCSRFGEGEARSMKPRNGLAKDRTIPRFSAFLGFFSILGVFRKIEVKQGTME